MSGGADQDFEPAFRPVARIRSDFHQKFGIPRQAGLVEELRADVVFEPEFRSPDIVRGLETFSHVWLIWGFSKVDGSQWTPTVRPPRLGGVRQGVFATRSPHRPNPIGLSSVRLVSVRTDGHDGPVLEVAGADLLDGTPIYDIKPYVPGDSHPDAEFSWTGAAREPLTIEFPAELEAAIPEDKRAGLRGILAEDPRPAFHHDPDRGYGVAFAGYNVRFTVGEDRVLHVTGVEPIQQVTD